MKPLRPTPAAERRGAALLLSLLILFVLVAIVFQISIGTATNSRVGRNDITLTKMDHAIESAMLEVEQLLITDAEAAADQGDEEGGGFGQDPGADPGATGDDGLGSDGSGEEGGGAGAEAVDSRRDEYMRPQRTEINGIQLRILVQDEDSKFNVLLLMSEDEAEADFAKEQLIRLLDLCREDTRADIDRAQAEEMAEDMRDHMLQRQGSELANPTLITTDEENEDRGFPMSLKEFAVLDSFDLGMFRDFRDEDGNICHSLGTYMTVWTSLAPAAEVAPRETEGQNIGPGEDIPANDGADGSEGSGGTAPNGGGFAVNINTAPAAVLKCLFEDRDVSHQFWDDVIEYRNLEEEDEEGEEDDESDPPLDEFGEEIIERKIFEDLGELSELDTYDQLEDEARPLVESRLRVTSDVFTVYITARRATSQEDEFAMNSLGTQRERREQEVESGTALLRTVRAVFWRTQNADGEIDIIPLIRWEVLDYVPFEVQDFPDDDR